MVFEESSRCVVLYRFRADLAATNLRLFSPRTREGVGILDVRPNFAADYECVDVRTVDAAFVDVQSAGVVVDVLQCSPSFMLVSSFVKDLICDMSYDPSNISFVPTSIVGGDRGTVAGLSLMYSINRLDIVDYGRTEFTTAVGRQQIHTRPHRIVLDEDRIPKLDIFQIRQSDWLVTDSLVSRCRAADVRGAAFVPLDKHIENP